jgi:hypothetical protein
VHTRWLQDRRDNLPAETDADESAALGYILDAWEEAVSDGVHPRALANAALFAAFCDLVEAYGESAVVSMAEGLKARVQRGEFTLSRRLQ